MKLANYFKKAQKEGWAIGQFNFTTDEQLKGIIAAAEELNSPIILGTSEGESQFLGLKKIKALVDAFRADSSVPIFLNLDHGKNLDYIKEAIKVGYDCVHFDGSSLSLEENIRLTKGIVKLASKKGTMIEGEVGIIGGKLTDPKEAKEFVQQTRVGRLAINIGTVHGGKAKIDFKRLNEIKEAIDNTPLVLHGGSGVNNTDIKKVIESGIVKININTELRLAWKKGLEDIFKEDKGQIKPYKILTPLSEKIKKVVEDKIKLFGSENKA